MEEYKASKEDNSFQLEEKQTLNIPENIGYGDKIRGPELMTIKTENMADVVRGFGIVDQPERASLPAAKPCTYSPWKPKGRK